jgi:SAM-dependent methyltransferase
MPRINDPHYLREQYQDAGNLNARIRLHQKFSVNDYGWFRWVFDRFDLSEDACILELGCGPGLLWQENARRIPSGWEVALSDFSPGMLSQARANLKGIPHPFAFEVIDAQNIPYPAARFDAVIANHFLYHVPDRTRAIAEIRRVLKENGRLYATTVGDDHMEKITRLVNRFDPGGEIIIHGVTFPFTLKNGGDQLRTAFARVEICRYPDELRITEAQPLVDYILSSTRFSIPADDALRADLLRFIESELAANDGVITVHKESGMLIADS